MKSAFTGVHEELLRRKVSTKKGQKVHNNIPHVSDIHVFTMVL